MKKKYYTGMGAGPKNAQLQDESLVTAKKMFFQAWLIRKIREIVKMTFNCKGTIIKNIKNYRKLTPKIFVGGGGIKNPGFICIFIFLTFFLEL